MVRTWFRGKGRGLITFLVIAGLVAGGLGWVTAAALRLEEEQRLARMEADRYGQLRLALWRLDSRLSPVLAREDSRPYNHYSAVYAPSLALRNDGYLCSPGTVLEPSPLLNEDLPDWMLLHFQIDEESGWASPQVLDRSLLQHLDALKIKGPFRNVTAQRRRLLAELAFRYSAKTLLAVVQQRGLQLSLEDTTLMPASGREQPNSQARQAAETQSRAQDYLARKEQKSRVMKESKSLDAQEDEAEVVLGNVAANGREWFSRNPVRPTQSDRVFINLSPMAPLWLKGAGEQDRLLVARLVRVGQKQVCQGIVLDWPRLQALLVGEMRDSFPAAEIQPVRDDVPPHPERTMTALPLELDPGPPPVNSRPAGWSPLRVGLVLAWAAALVALLAVGLGGWSLLDLSERRIRFVSAVTHELRTPLTTLRLYLDMLAGGMVTEEKQKSEYLQTLNAEADRLNRLIGNVLDFSRLENQRPRLAVTQTALKDLLEQLRSTWQGRCQDAGKELIVENGLDGETQLRADLQLLQQILGNLIDNSCKYSRGAADRRIWLRVRREGGQRLVFEVEDRGPGVPLRERRSIFRPFRRGRSVDISAGGAGLGLALAQRWAHLLGGKLAVQSGHDGIGACFRLELPLPSPS